MTGGTCRYNCRMKAAPVLILIALAWSASGCGQKGPLVLPSAEHPRKKVKFPAAPKSTAPATPGAPATPAAPATEPSAPAGPAPEPAPPEAAPGSNSTPNPAPQG
jgi:predicted small lipoprotein YifL